MELEMKQIRIQWTQIRRKHMSIGYCKKDVTPLLTYWSYVFFALNHRCDMEKANA